MENWQNQLLLPDVLLFSIAIIITINDMVITIIIIIMRFQVMFAIVIFAIIGLEFYSGALHKSCYSIHNLGHHHLFYHHHIFNHP